MKPYAALLALAATACGLDVFDWGGSKQPCEVEWRMYFDGFERFEWIRPEVRDVVQRGSEPGNLTWTARYHYAGQRWEWDLWIRDLALQPVLWIDPDADAPQFEFSGPCSWDERPSEARADPLVRYVCAIDLTTYCRGGRIPAEEDPCGIPRRLEGAAMVLEEVDRCAD